MNCHVMSDRMGSLNFTSTTVNDYVQLIVKKWSSLAIYSVAFLITCSFDKVTYPHLCFCERQQGVPAETQISQLSELRELGY
jgi:hypothetical protein